MRFNKLLALLLAVLMIFAQLPVWAADEEATFTVSSITPSDGATNISLINLQVDVTFSEPVDPSTLNVTTISVSGSAFHSVVAKSDTSATIYLNRAKLEAGTKYTVTLKNSIKALSGASLVEKKITFQTSREIPSYRQITNQHLDDPYSLGGFIGDTVGNISIVNYEGDNVLKFVTPGWEQGAVKTNPLINPGSTYTGRVRIKLESDSEAWLACVIYQPGNADFYRYSEHMPLTAGQWYTLEHTWTVPEDTDASQFQFMVAVQEQNIVAYLDDFYFFETGNDVDPPENIGGGAGASYAVISDDNTPLNKFKAFDLISDAAEGDATISRIDLANALLKIKGLEQLPVVTSTKFTDVSETDMATVQSVVDIGLMNGASDTTFEPSEKVTLDQAVKTLVNLMGWGEVAEQNGGFPGGYNKVAVDLGLTKNMNASAGTTFTNNDFAMLLNNALDAQVLDVVKYNGTMNAHFLVKDGTFMDTFLEYGYGKGVIEGNDVTYIYKEGATPEGKVQIGDDIYLCDADLQEYLGYEVYYYFEESEDNDPPRIKYITGISNNNEVVEFSTYDDYVDFTDNTYYHAVDGQKKSDKYELLNNKNVIYNGKYLDSYTNDASTFVPAYGTVKIIDNGEGFSTVVITDVRTVFVSAVDYTNKVIYDDKGGAPIDLSECDDPVILDKEGSPWNFKDIKQWTVASIIASKDGELATIYLSTDSVTGPLVSVSTEGDKSVLVIGDDGYGTAVRASYKVVDSYYDATKLALTSSGTFYLDWQGRVVAYSVGTAASGVGYLINAALDDENLDAKLEVKIFDSNGKFLYLEGADKVTVDTERVKTPERVIELLSKGTGAVVPQLVLFATDREGNLVQIDTAYNKVPNTTDYTAITPTGKDDPNGFRVTYSSLMKPTGDPSAPTELQCRPGAASFQNKVLFSTKVQPTIFNVPLTNTADAEDNNFAIYRGFWDFSSNGSSFKVESYKVDNSSMFADYGVIFRDGPAKSNDDSKPRGIVTEKKLVMKDNETVTEITANTYDGTKKIYDKGQTYSRLLKVGDYAEFNCDRDGFLYENPKIVYCAKTNTMNSGNPTAGYADYNRAFLANVYEKQDSVVRAIATSFTNLGDESVVLSNSELLNLGSANVYYYHRDKNEVMAGSLSEILDYKNAGDEKSTILILSREAVVHTVYIVTE